MAFFADDQLFQRQYRVREQHQTIYASSDDKIKHNKAGDVDSGRAWKQLRKASDMVSTQRSRDPSFDADLRTTRTNTRKSLKL